MRDLTISVGAWYWATWFLELREWLQLSCLGRRWSAHPSRFCNVSARVSALVAASVSAPAPTKENTFLASSRSNRSDWSPLLFCAHPSSISLLECLKGSLIAWLLSFRPSCPSFGGLLANWSDRSIAPSLLLLATFATSGLSYIDWGSLTLREDSLDSSACVVQPLSIFEAWF